MDLKKNALGVLVLACASTALADPPRGDRAECAYREAFNTRFTQQWFHDVADLDAHWVETHQNPGLPEYKRYYCAERASGRTSQGLLNDTVSNTLAFINPNGPLGGGMCWMHSRLQRRATYLANYRPDLPRPTAAQATQLIHRLAAGDSVVEIPGYRDLHDFSADFQSQFESEMNSMGVACFFNLNDCAARFQDSYTQDAPGLRGIMDQLYSNVVASPGDVYFLRSRVPDHPLSRSAAHPFVAHSMLVVGMQPLDADGSPIAPGRAVLTHPLAGYRLNVIDPNNPSAVEDVIYRFGDTTIVVDGERSVPYRHYEYEGDLPQMRAAIAGYCR